MSKSIYPPQYRERLVELVRSGRSPEKGVPTAQKTTIEMSKLSCFSSRFSERSNWSISGQVGGGDACRKAGPWPVVRKGHCAARDGAGRGVGGGAWAGPVD
jgi:hypothetical protein